MTVVSNTSPISYLVLIDQIDLLPRIFTTLIIPTTVRDGTHRPQSPDRRPAMDRQPTQLAVYPIHLHPTRSRTAHP